MIDHVNIPVSDLSRAKAQYRKVLGELGLELLVEEAEVAGFGRTHWSFGLLQAETPIFALHVAFTADSHEAVRAAYRVGLDSGFRCNGEPGQRPEYGPGYYAAFMTDQDGHNIEAVCRG